MAKKIITYTKILDEMGAGVVRSASEVRDAIKPYALFRLNLEGENKRVFDTLLADMERLNSTVDEQGKNALPHQKRVTLETFRKVSRGEPVNWSTIDKITKDHLKLDRKQFHLGHTDISNMQIWLSAVKNHLRKSDRPTTFDATILKAEALLHKLDTLDANAIKKLGSITNKHRESLFANKSEAQTRALIGLLNNGDDISLKETHKQSYIPGSEATNVIDIHIESATENLIKGAIGADVRKLIDHYLFGSTSSKNFAQAIFDKIDINISSSPGLLDDISSVLDKVFIAGKAKRVTRKGSSRVHVKTKGIPGLKQTKNTIRVPRFKTRKVVDTGLTLLPILNELLPEHVRNYMGDSTDAPIKLRNQTGRFSESVEAVGITSTRSGATTILYTFMRDPYGTFLPGGNLYTPERDPSSFIPWAIRDIARRFITTRLRITSELV